MIGLLEYLYGLKWNDKEHDYLSCTSTFFSSGGNKGRWGEPRACWESLSSHLRQAYGSHTLSFRPIPFHFFHVRLLELFHFRQSDSISFSLVFPFAFLLFSLFRIHFYSLGLLTFSQYRYFEFSFILWDCYFHSLSILMIFHIRVFVFWLWNIFVVGRVGSVDLPPWISVAAICIEWASIHLWYQQSQNHY